MDQMHTRKELEEEQRLGVNPEQPRIMTRIPEMKTSCILFLPIVGMAGFRKNVVSLGGGGIGAI